MLRVIIKGYKGGSIELESLITTVSIHALNFGDQLTMLSLFTNTRSLCAEEAETGHLGHAGVLPSRLPAPLEEGTLFANPSPHVTYLGVGGAVVAGMTITRAVWTYLFSKAQEFRKHRSAGAGRLFLKFLRCLRLHEL